MLLVMTHSQEGLGDCFKNAVKGKIDHKKGKKSLTHTTWPPSLERLIPMGLGRSKTHSPRGLNEFTWHYQNKQITVNR